MKNKKSLMQKIEGIPVGVMLCGIAFYRRAISPVLHAIFGSEGFCRFTPTCSEYARQAFLQHGFFKGFALSFWRLLRCNPFCDGGADPVPPHGSWHNSHGKIGIFGGCFDPVHNAHIALAEAARDALGLDSVIFVPAAHSPLKDSTPSADAEARVEMLEAAIAGRDGFEVSDWELTQGGVSYSVDTARHFAELHPFAELYWILGADQLAVLDKWKDIEALSHIVRFAVMCRDEKKIPPLPGDVGKYACVDALSVPPVDVSSTFVREKISSLSDEKLFEYVPENVVKIIRKRNLYANAES